MAVSAVASSPVARRGLIFAGLFLALAAALGVAIFRPGINSDRIGSLGENIANQAGTAAAALKALGNTVSQIFESRSPGERIGGALASLKHARHPVLHERALPKIRGPLSPLATIIGAPAMPPVLAPVPEAPLYNMVQGTPVPFEAPVAGGAPVMFPGAPPLPGGGGGGGVIFPPLVNQPPGTPVMPPETPPVTPPLTPPLAPPTAPSVPEPTTWAMMLIGFVLIGRAVRRPCHIPIHAD